MSEKMKSKITTSDINKMEARCFLVQNSHNYERMISLGVLYAFTPILKKCMKEDLKKKL